MPRPRLHALDIAEYQEIALNADFDAHETLEIGDAWVSIGRHRHLGMIVVGCGPAGGFLAEVGGLPARHAEPAP